MILKQHDLVYVPHKAVKGQVLADCLADHLIPNECELNIKLPGEDVFFVDILLPWEMLFDRVTRNDGVGVSVVFVFPKKMSSPIRSC